MTREERTQNFIKKAIEIHGESVDYSKTKYPLVDGKLTFICPIHGEFTQVPGEHLKSKTPCPICGHRVINSKIFLEKAKKVHGDKFDYSKIGDIKTSKDIVTIICPIHGEFKQEVNSHLQGRGCAKCSGKKFCLEDYIRKANLMWNNKYDYSKFEWKGINEPVCIICPEHGEFWQLPNNHLKGECGCLECRGKSKDFKLLNSLDELIKRSKEKYGDKFDFSKAEWKGSRIPIKIICPEHGEFETLPRQFLLNEYGCPNCNPNRFHAPQAKVSNGEKLIMDILDSYNIKYKYNYELVTKTIARNSNVIIVDFVVTKNKHLYFIEYNGRQHYEYTPFFHKGGIIDFEKQQRRDQLLRNICDLHKDKITLIEIKYDMKEDQIKKLITETLGI